MKSAAQSSTLEIPTARAFVPLLQPARYKGAYGGRGSGKSHFFAEMLVEECLRFPGTRAVCVREVQKSLKESAKKLIEDKIQSLGLGRKFEVLNTEIKTPGGGVILFQGMQDHTAESIKSLEGMHYAWVEEAQTLSATSLEMLRPTIRWEDKEKGRKSELWFSWNPRRKNDPVDVMLRQKTPAGAVVIKANWKDNPWFPDVLEDERQDSLKNDPEGYETIWEGDYIKVRKGAYFAPGLLLAKNQGRIGRVALDPLMAIRSYHDIGGAGAKADAYSIWVCQFINREIRVLDHYSSQGQTLDFHVNWMRERGYGKAEVFLPHDGVNENNVTGKRYEDHWRDAGFSVTSIPNQGPGAAMQRVRAAQRVFPMIWFNETTTEAGRDSLGWYHEKRHDLGHGLGPEHDFSSHDADAFGMMCIHYNEPRTPREVSAPKKRSAWAL